MADLSQIQVNGTDYDIKDATARATNVTQSEQIVQLQTADTQTRNMISDAWSSSSVPYTVGSYAIYNNTLWKCLVENSVAPSEGSNWTEVNIGNLIKNKIGISSAQYLSVPASGNASASNPLSGYDFYLLKLENQATDVFGSVENGELIWMHNITSSAKNTKYRIIGFNL